MNIEGPDTRSRLHLGEPSDNRANLSSHETRGWLIFAWHSG